MSDHAPGVSKNAPWRGIFGQHDQTWENLISENVVVDRTMRLLVWIAK